jgi:hypothetical protein
MGIERASTEQILNLVKGALRRGARVDIDGLGSFRSSDNGTIGFIAQNRPKVFIAYVTEDSKLADRLFDNFTSLGFDPWMDRRKLMPGQNWPRAIEDAIAVSDFFVACFSQRSVKKRGGFQAEIRYALDCATHVPLDQVFLIPVRLDECRVPSRIQREVQYIDLFPDWEAGIRRIVQAIEKQIRGKKAA